jgi:hypothetical protein
MMDANQAKVKADIKEMKEEMLAKMDANQAKTDATQERMNANLRKEMKSTVNAL